jgi:class 3 adenylate cyclase
MRKGLTAEEELQVRRLRFGPLLENEYREETSLGSRRRLQYVFEVGYLIIAALTLYLEVYVRRADPHSALEQEKAFGLTSPGFLAVVLGLPLLPFVASWIRPLSRYVMSLSAMSWAGVIATILTLFMRPTTTVENMNDIALLEIAAASCAVVIIRMPAYLVAACAFGLFADYVWVWRVVAVIHAQQQHVNYIPELRAKCVQLLAWSTLFVIGAYYTETIDRRAFLTRRLLAEERERTRALIANMLPASITDRLLDGTRVIAERHEDVTVMFLDIVDFTPYAASHPAEEVVGRLNELFSRFDDLTDKFGLEKIKTVGDAYMVAGGVPEYRSDHFEVTLRLGLALQEAAKKLNFEVRVGAHRGSVMAGVIGSKKYLYDLWGDTVNTASRMESHSLPGKLQVMKSIAVNLPPDLKATPRGNIEVKGLGPVETVWISK